MRKIYTGIDLGSYSIKIVVCEVINNNFHVLAASNTRCKGIKNGIVVDIEEAKQYLNKAKQDVEGMLGIPINKAIVTVPQQDIDFNIVDGVVPIESEDKIITEEDVNNVLHEAVLGKIKDGHELITLTPISFQIDGKEAIKDPKDLTGDSLSMKAVSTSIPKNNLKTVLSLLKECGIEAIDVTFGSVGDYFEARNADIDSKVAAVVNLGYNKTEVSIYNKGIMIKNEIINNGSKLVDKDLAYMYNIKRGQAKKLKENFAVSNTRYSDVNDKMELITKNGEEIVVNQLEVSEIVEARLVELLKLVKKQINILTNREISYIIITGGISELAGFEYVVENVFDRRCFILNINTMGIRNNMYSSSYGIIKYFNNKLDFKGLSYSMINEEEIEKMMSTKEKISAGNRDNIISKVFGYFSGE